MKIPFNSVGTQVKPIDYTLKGVDFEINLQGSLKRKSYGIAELDAVFKGNVLLECDACAEAINETVEEKVTLKLTDAPYSTSEGHGDELDYDIIEFLDGMIDLDEIIISEVNTIKYDYHKCEKCK